jgi:hypothetical protein
MGTIVSRRIVMATQAERFCRCVKDVSRKITLRRNLAKTKEGAATAICTKAILWPQGRTIRRFSCRGKKAKLVTQKRRM